MAQGLYRPSPCSTLLRPSTNRPRSQMPRLVARPAHSSQRGEVRRRVTTVTTIPPFGHQPIVWARSLPVTRSVLARPASVLPNKLPQAERAHRHAGRRIVLVDVHTGTTEASQPGLFPDLPHSAQPLTCGPFVDRRTLPIFCEASESSWKCMASGEPPAHLCASALLSSQPHRTRAA